MSRPPGNWVPVGPAMFLSRHRCVWCKKQGLPRPTLYRVMADGDSPFAAVVSPVCARCVKAASEAAARKERRAKAEAFIEAAVAGEVVLPKK